MGFELEKSQFSRCGNAGIAHREEDDDSVYSEEEKKQKVPIVRIALHEHDKIIKPAPVESSIPLQVLNCNQDIMMAGKKFKI